MLLNQISPEIRANILDRLIEMNNQLLMNNQNSQSIQLLIQSAFQLLQFIMANHFNLIVETGSNDTIDEIVNCLVAFATNLQTDIAQISIQFLYQCAEYLGKPQAKALAR